MNTLMASGGALRRAIQTAGWWVPIAILCVLCGAAVPLLLIRSEPIATATAKVELTEEVVWPFYGAVTQRLFVAADSIEGDSFFDSPAEIESFEVVVPVGEAWVDVIVEAQSTDVAISAANAMSAHIVKLVNSDANESFAADATLITQQLDDVAEERISLEVLISEATQAETEFDEKYRQSQELGVPDSELRLAANLAEDTKNSLRRERDQVIQRSGTLQRELDSVVVSASGGRPIVRVLSQAVVPPLEDSPRLLGALLGAMTGLILAAVLGRSVHLSRVSMFDREEVAMATGLHVTELRPIEVVLQLFSDAKLGPLALVGSESARNMVLLSSKDQLSDEELHIISSGSDAVSDRHAVDLFVARISDATDTHDVVLLDVADPGTGWAYVALSHARIVYIVVRPGETKSRELGVLADRVQSYASTVNVLLIKQTL